MVLIHSVNWYNSNKLNFDGRFINGMKKPRHIKESVANKQFVQYNPLKKVFGNYVIPVHNEGIAQKMSDKYDLFSFRRLFSFAKLKGVFDYIMNEKTGFIKTSFINRKENELMSDLIWITDSCNNMELVKHKKPEDCTKIFNKLTDFYEGQKDNFDKAIEHPEKYKDNGFWQMETTVGVGHCFVPKTHKPHIWFAKTRLESVGNYLQTASDLIMSGFGGKGYGYKNVNEIPQTVVDAIANSVKYLKAIKYPIARSCGAWEEQTFVNSLTSDTAIVNKGMRDIRELMYSETTDKNLLGLRERIRASKHGDVFDNKAGLDKIIRTGEARVRRKPFQETTQGSYSKSVKPWEEKCLARDYDAAMSFVFQTEKMNKTDVYKDAEYKMESLEKLTDNLVRENGMLRYKGDEYINLDYHTRKNVTVEGRKYNEAEWFLTSEVAAAYGSIADGLIKNIKAKGNISARDKELLGKAMEKETEYINRSYARITPKGMTKSNGYSCPEYKVPEAYEAVTTPRGIKYVPGAHTLTWASSSLHKASRIFEKNLKDLTELNLI